MAGSWNGQTETNNVYGWAWTGVGDCGRFGCRFKSIKVTNGNIKVLANQNQAQVTRLKYSGQIQTALNDQKWSEAQKDMQRAGYPSTKQVSVFLKHRQYQQALNVDPSQLNKVVNAAYANQDNSQVADWQLPTKATSKQKDQLKLEKAIVNYDTNTLNNQLSFTTTLMFYWEWDKRI